MPRRVPPKRQDHLPRGGAILGETAAGPTSFLITPSPADRFLVVACTGLMVAVRLCTWRE